MQCTRFDHELEMKDDLVNLVKCVHLLIEAHAARMLSEMRPLVAKGTP